MTVEQRAEALIVTIVDNHLQQRGRDSKAAVIAALRAHEAEVIERCARECDKDCTGQLLNGGAAYIRQEKARDLASRIRALAQKGTGNGD